MNTQELDRYIELKSLAEIRFLKKSKFKAEKFLNLNEQIEYKQLEIKYLEM